MSKSKWLATGYTKTPTPSDSENLIEGEGNGFELPLKAKVTGPWLTKLGGGPCLVGNDAHPIIQDLTSSGAGSPGHATLNPSFTQAEISGSRLVDFDWPLEEASSPTGCGGAYETYVDKAMNVLVRKSTRARRVHGAAGAIVHRRSGRREASGRRRQGVARHDHKLDRKRLVWKLGVLLGSRLMEGAGSQGRLGFSRGCSEVDRITTVPGASRDTGCSSEPTYEQGSSGQR